MKLFVYSILISLALFEHAPSVLAATHGYAVDIYQPVTASEFKCIKNNGYSVAFIRAYCSNNRGKGDINLKSNVLNAQASGLGIELFIQPNPSEKSGLQHFDELNSHLRKSGVTATRVWLLVTDPRVWSNNYQNNIAFINSFYNRARAMGYKIGIYTNWYDWRVITENYRALSHDVLLWYWLTLGEGPAAESNPNFNDFRPFGYWNQAIVKQFGIIETFCGVQINRNVFPLNNNQMKTPIGKAARKSKS